MVEGVVDWDVWTNGELAMDSRLVYTDASGSLWYKHSDDWSLENWSLPVLVDYGASSPGIILVGTDDTHTLAIRVITYLKGDKLLIAQLAQ